MAAARRIASAAAFACLVASPAAIAPALAAGAPALLYTPPAGFADDGFEAAPTSDGFLLIFDRYSASEETGAVIAKRFTPAGVQVGADIVVDAPNENAATRPDLLPLGGGRFLATWNHGAEIRASILDVDAGTAGPATTVAQNRYLGFSHEPAALGSGRLAVVTRVARGKRNEDTVLTILDPSLGRVGKPSVLEEDKPAFIGDSGVFPTSEQTIVAVGAGARAIYHAADNSMRGVAIGATGKPADASFPVSSTPGFAFNFFELIGFRVDALALPDGGFAVAWMAREQAGDSGFGRYDVRARVFDADGTPRGPDFLAHPRRQQSQAWPTLVPAKGGFGVAYISASVEGTAGDFAIRFFDARGKALTGEIVTRSFAGTTDDPSADTAPATVRLPKGSYVSVYARSGGVYFDAFGDPTKAP